MGRESRWPIWRTKPAGFAASSYWSILTALVVGWVGVAFIGLVCIEIAMLASDVATTDVLPSVNEPLIQSVYWFGIILWWSPLAAWVVVLFAVLVLSKLAATGYAGWGVALLFGLLCGFGVTSILSVSSKIPISVAVDMTLLLSAVSLIYSVVVWLALRSFHPSFLGLGPKDTI